MKYALTAAATFALLSSCSSSAPDKPPVAEEKKAETPAKPAAQPAGAGGILRVDAALNGLVPAGAKIEKVAGGFQFTEGPLWFKESGNLWFSDVQGNVVRQLAPDGAVTEILKPGGFDGKDAPEGAFIGPNGMTFDKDGNVLIAQHGNRRIARRNKAGVVTTLVDRFEGKRLNSPNDLVFKTDGALYFTDPPYGLTKQDDDPKKELPYNGVFRLKNGKLTLLNKEMTRPNGIAFSPDEKWLYVANSDAARKAWMKFPVQEDGTLGPGSVFADVTAEQGEGLPDGLKVDAKGNVWATGPGGIWIFSPEGKHLGTIQPTEVPANCAFAEDGSVLWMTARTSVYRIKLK
ncbi:MAG TPA: SMP-30/gluconolactonase/LRE family protein [Bryobacteraceae bacterium]|nr:SMP-30/gluconolactonase/LRE family protein [Bryobacteraceae bacterium]